jgi:hypothetical protein
MGCETCDWKRFGELPSEPRAPCVSLEGLEGDHVQEGEEDGKTRSGSSLPPSVISAPAERNPPSPGPRAPLIFLAYLVSLEPEAIFVNIMPTRRIRNFSSVH